jgi:hypothetical protein
LPSRHFCAIEFRKEMLQMTRQFSYVLLLSVMILGSTATRLNAKEEKLKLEQLLAKHLASIGTPEALAAAHSRVMAGTAQVIFRLGGAGLLNGKGNVVSDGRKYFIGMDFGVVNYPGDLFAFDGENLTVNLIKPGRRSNLGDFIYQHDVLLKEGLLGGTMTTAWPLLDLTLRQPKMNYSGLKKVEGRNLHEVKYRARKGGGDLQISLYFEPETFRHVASRFRLVVPATMGATPSDSANQRETVYTLDEQFGNFATVDSLTLPYFYKLTMTMEGQSSSYLTEWNLQAEKVSQNQQVDPGTFVVK